MRTPVKDPQNHYGMYCSRSTTKDVSVHVLQPMVSVDRCDCKGELKSSYIQTKQQISENATLFLFQHFDDSIVHASVEQRTDFGRVYFLLD
jgi:hypothetical protein